MVHRKRLTMQWTHSLTLSLSHTHTHTHTLRNTHTNTHTHMYTFFLRFLPSLLCQHAFFFSTLPPLQILTHTTQSACLVSLSEAYSWRSVVKASHCWRHTPLRGKVSHVHQVSLTYSLENHSSHCLTTNSITFTLLLSFTGPCVPFICQTNIDNHWEQAICSKQVLWL